MTKNISFLQFGIEEGKTPRLWLLQTKAFVQGTPEAKGNYIYLELAVLVMCFMFFSLFSGFLGIGCG